MRPLLRQQFLKRLLCAALAVVLFAGFVPMRTEAYSEEYAYKVTTLKQNTYVTAEGYSETYNYDTDVNSGTYYLYKITVPANGFITLQTTNSSNDLSIYKGYKKNQRLSDEYELAWLDDCKTYYRVMSKGVYYIYASKGTRFKWKFTKASNSTNYCRARAKTLAAKKKLKVVINHRYECDRWYRVVLKKKKTITVNFNVLDEEEMEFDIYNSKGSHIDCPLLSGTRYRTARLPKGKYFIRVRGGGQDYDNRGRICQIMWK